MDSIYSLLQKPINFEKNEVKGKLFVKGNTKDNLIQFFVFFSSREMIIPLLLSIKDSYGKLYKVFLMLKDEEHINIASHLYEPEYLIRKGISIVDIRPLILMEDK